MKPPGHPTRILVLYGPNTNLLGKLTRGSGAHMTLDKWNRALHRKARQLEVELSIHQHQSESKACTLLQRQRNKVHGVLLIPGIWGIAGLQLRETLAIVKIPVALFQPDCEPWHGKGLDNLEDLAHVVAPGINPEEVAGCLEALLQHLQGP